MFISTDMFLAAPSSALARRSFDGFQASKVFFSSALLCYVERDSSTFTLAGGGLRSRRSWAECDVWGRNGRKIFPILLVAHPFTLEGNC